MHANIHSKILTYIAHTYIRVSQNTRKKWKVEVS